MILSDFHTFITMSLSYRTQLGACDFGTCRSALRRSCWCLNLDGEKNWGRTKRRMTISAILFQKKNTFPNLPQYLSHWLNRDALQSRKSHLCVFFIGLLVRKLLRKQVLVGSFLWIFVLFFVLLFGLFFSTTEWGSTTAAFKAEPHRDISLLTTQDESRPLPNANNIK